MAKPEIQIVGPRTLQNDLLARFLEKEMGAEVSCSIISGWKVEDAGASQDNSLVLLDFNNLNLSQFSQRLESRSNPKKPLDFAVFNVCLDYTPETLIREMLSHGLRGLFSEDESMDLMARGIRAIFNRELWVPRQILADLLTEVTSVPSPSPNQAASLTGREKEILLVLASGACNKEIADQLCVSPHTVRTHIHNAFAKIGVTSRLQAALWATSNLKTGAPLKTRSQSSPSNEDS